MTLPTHPRTTIVVLVILSAWLAPSLALAAPAATDALDAVSAPPSDGFTWKLFAAFALVALCTFAWTRNAHGKAA